MRTGDDNDMKRKVVIDCYFNNIELKTNLFEILS